MRNIPKSIFSRVVEGFLVLLAYLMMGQLSDVMLAMAVPIADLLPNGIASSGPAL